MSIRLPHIKILATGGTIAGAATKSTNLLSYTSGAVAIEEIIKTVPELENIANISGEQIAQLHGTNMHNAVWLKLAKRANELLKDPIIDGIVVTHGTDTIEETAYFLNLVIKSDKPVVVVGAMRPSTGISADGPINLYNAVSLAGSAQAKGKGVLVTLNDTIDAAREVTKTKTALADTFISPELGALGYMHAGKPVFYRESTRRHTLHTEFDISELAELPIVDIVYGYTTNRRAGIDALVQTGSKGLVHAGTGNGNIYSEANEALIDARKAGVTVVRSTRVSSGIVARNGGVNDDECDFVAADNLNPQKARILLMLALTKTTSAQEIQRIFEEY